MTKKEALKILIESSKRDIVGQGLGFRSTTEEWREKVRKAIRKMYKYAYGYELTDGQFNYEYGF